MPHISQKATQMQIKNLMENHWKVLKLPYLEILSTTYRGLAEKFKIQTK